MTSIPDARRCRPRSAQVNAHVLVVESADALRQWTTAWEDLSVHAVEPNAFYEPWMLLPALDFLTKPEGLFVVLVVAKAASGGPDHLCGLFPLVRPARYQHLPLRHLTLWRHEYCFLGTPLIRKGWERETLTALLDWVAEDPRGSTFLEFPLVTADGPFFHLLSTTLEERESPVFVSKHETRALLRPRANGDAYIAEALPGRSRKEYRRLERRLAELGPLEYIEPGPADIESWSEAFLDLEAKGWKGRGGTAMACTDGGRRFFAAVARAGPKRVMLLGLYVDGRPVALKCNVLSGEAAFSFKIAFDETHKQYSPGVLLELENIRRFHAKSELRWVDSCAKPEHFMANRLWLDRRSLNTLLVSTGGTASDLVVESLPLMRWASGKIRGLRDRGAQAESLLDVNPGALRANFGRKPFSVRHRLGELGLFHLPRLLELARRLPESSVEYNAGNVPLTLDPSQTPRTGLSVEETLQRISTCGSWMVLKNVEQDPAYRDLLERCLAEIHPLSHAVSPGMRRKEGFIFISSPGSVTPYHMDPEENFLLQIRGRKTIHVFDGSDRSVLTDEQIERSLTGGGRNLVFRDEYQPKARTFTLGPGEGVHVPVTSPHWVQNREEVSVSFSITFQTKSSIRSSHAHRMNATLRRWDLQPAPVGHDPWRDKAKQLAHRVTHVLAG